MSLPTTLEAALILTLVFVPGFIFGQFIQRAIAHYPEKVDARHFLAILAFGLLLHVVIYPLSTRYVVNWYFHGTLNDHWFALYLWAIIAIFAWPVIAGGVMALLIPMPWIDKQLDRFGFGYIDRLPTAWDYAVRLGPAWDKVYLQDGGIVAGKFQNGSVASVNQNHRDIYVEEVYTVDDTGTIGDPVPDSLGMWIGAGAINRIEFLNGGTID